MAAANMAEMQTSRSSGEPAVLLPPNALVGQPTRTALLQNIIDASAAIVLESRKFVFLAALGVMLPSAVEAAVITINSNDAAAAATWASSVYDGVSIPASQNVSADDGLGGSSQIDVSYTGTGNNVTLSHALTQARTGNQYDYAQYYDLMTFTAEMNAVYEISGYYNVDDIVDSGEQVMLRVSLYDETVDEYLLDNFQISFSTEDETFVVGAAEGDDNSLMLGSLIGDLVVGHQYQWYSNAVTQAYSNADGGATAAGNVTLSINSIGAVPLPGALPLFLSGLAGLGLMGWRRRRRKSADNGWQIKGE